MATLQVQFAFPDDTEEAKAAATKLKDDLASLLKGNECLTVRTMSSAGELFGAYQLRTGNQRMRNILAKLDWSNRKKAQSLAMFS
jgi:hypothetical protein